MGKLHIIKLNIENVMTAAAKNISNKDGLLFFFSPVNPTLSIFIIFIFPP
jgi:hypothetical protein